MKLFIPDAIKRGLPYLVWWSMWPTSYVIRYGLTENEHFVLAIIGSIILLIATGVSYVHYMVEGK